VAAQALRAGTMKTIDIKEETKEGLLSKIFGKKMRRPNSCD